MNITISVNDMIKEIEIINDAVNNLKRITSLDQIEYKEVDKDYDYDVTINGQSFACKVKNQVTKANYNLVIQQMRKVGAQTQKPLLLVANHFVPEIFTRFLKDEINVIESNGNCSISVAPLFIHISGQKSIQPKENIGRAFKETGLKVIFYFLLEDTNIGKPFRTISEDTGVSLGTIKNVIDDLLAGQFVFMTDKGRVLKNKRQLLDIWQIHYNQSMKPKLLVKEMDFTDATISKEWNQLQLPEGMCWAGEGGAFLWNKYLIPETYDIYSEVPTVKLLMTRKFKLQEGGRIKVYQKFWKGNIAEHMAPKILVYADLMGSGNSRCIEAAQRLIEHDEL